MTSSLRYFFRCLKAHWTVARPAGLSFVAHFLMLASMGGMIFLFRWSETVAYYWGQSSLIPLTLLEGLFLLRMIVTACLAVGLAEGRPWARRGYLWSTPGFIVAGKLLYPSTPLEPSILLFWTLDPVLGHLPFHDIAIYGFTAWYLNLPEILRYFSTGQWNQAPASEVSSSPAKPVTETSLQLPSQTAVSGPVAKVIPLRPVVQTALPHTPPPGAPSAPPPSLRDAYELGELIGEGVSAKVYRAVEKASGRVVALKVLNPHLKTDPISLERFRREIQITRFLGHPRIVAIYDLVMDRDRYCMPMELVDGYNLKDYLKLNSPLPLDHALEFLRQMLDVLALCHGKQVIHRDLKPQNVMVTRDRMLKLLDFGIARMTSLGDLTQTGASLGSPEYMAPELFSSSSYDPRTDIYALGVVTFEMLTGRLPFEGETLAVLYRQHQEAPVPELSSLRPDAPPWLGHLVERMLAKRPFERYQCIEEIQADLRSQSVLSRRLPLVDRRPCIACAQETLLTLPVCTHCGFDTSGAFRAGIVDVHASASTDEDDLEDFLMDTFGDEAVSVATGDTLILSKVDGFAAETLRQAALRRGLYLRLVSGSEPTKGRKIAACAALLASGAATVGSAFLCVVNQVVPGWIHHKYAAGMPYGMESLFWLTVSGLALFASWRWSSRWIAEPMVSSETREKSPVSEHYAFLRELAPRLKEIATPGMRVFVAHLVEQFHQLYPVIQRTFPESGQIARDAVRLAVDAAVLVSTMEQSLASPEAQQANQAYARSGTGQEKLGYYLALEEKKGDITLRLTRLQYLFTSLLSRSLVLASTLEGADEVALKGAVDEIRDGLTATRELESGLGRAA